MPNPPPLHPLLESLNSELLADADFIETLMEGILDICEIPEHRRQEAYTAPDLLALLRDYVSGLTEGFWHVPNP